MNSHMQHLGKNTWQSKHHSSEHLRAAPNPPRRNLVCAPTHQSLSNYMQIWDRRYARQRGACQHVTRCLVSGGCRSVTHREK